MKVMDVIPYKYGAYYVFDRCYVDYKRLFNITNYSTYFVIRAKKNLQFKYNQINEVNERNGVMSDQIGKLTGFYISQYYPDYIRKVVYNDKETNRTFVYLTNNTTITSEQVALLNKIRWQVELFFKWINNI